MKEGKLISIKIDKRKGRKIPHRECFDKRVINRAKILLSRKYKSESIIIKLNDSQDDKEKKALKKQLEIFEKKNHKIYHELRHIKEELEKEYPHTKIPKIPTLSIWGKKYKSIE